MAIGAGELLPNIDVNKLHGFGGHATEDMLDNALCAELLQWSAC